MGQRVPRGPGARARPYYQYNQAPRYVDTIIMYNIESFTEGLFGTSNTRSIRYHKGQNNTIVKKVRVRLLNQVVMDGAGPALEVVSFIYIEYNYFLNCLRW